MSDTQTDSIVERSEIKPFELRNTGNSLKDIMDMAEDGAFIIIRNEMKQEMKIHKCKNCEETPKAYVFIHLTGYWNNLLNEGEWDFYLEPHYCTCCMRNKETDKNFPSCNIITLRM
jgi:hypothetical protein